MAKPLDTLLEDHRNIARLLDTLERHIAIFAEGGSPDYDVVAGAAAYFTDYPDICHHPLEDAIAAHMLAAYPAEAAALADLAGEHKVAHERARRFRRTMHELLAETDIARDEVVEAARRFIAFQRRHMRMEEDFFFPLAERLLTPADWLAVQTDHAARSDPLFGAEIAATFRTLRERLFRWEAEDLAIEAGEQR